MLQTLPEIFVGGLFLVAAILVLYLIGVRAKKVCTKLEKEVLKIPLLNISENRDIHESVIRQIKRRWQGAALVSGFSTISDIFYFWYLLLSSIFIIEDFISNLFFIMYILLLLFFVSGIGAGIVQIVRKRDFWNRQIDPIRGFETYLEKFVEKREKERPQKSSGRQFYPEVELQLISNWEENFFSSIKQEILYEIYSRELTTDDREIFLESLVRRDDIIGQAAIDVQDDFVMQES